MGINSPLYLSEEQKKQYVEDAKPYLELTLDQLWNSVTSQKIPRSVALTNPQTIGCPVCGKAVAPFGNYPYEIDYIHKPWKLTCPSCKSVFPTNDFKAYYEGGLDENGFFNPELAKKHNDMLIQAGEKGNLVNLLQPEKGENWGVDDSTGFVDANGQKYTFIAYYNHFAWYTGIIIQAVRTLKNAYLATHDPAYASRGLVILNRIADVYPDLTISEWKRSDDFLNCNGSQLDHGKAIGCIWETIIVADFIKAFGVFSPALLEGKCEEAVAYLKTKKPAVSSAEEIKKHVEDNLIRQVYPAVKNTDIFGNSGTHQATLATAAVVLNQNPETKEWIDFCFRTGKEESGNCTGGNINEVMVNRIDRDGFGTEASPGYNSGWLYYYLNVADVLEGYQIDGLEAADLYQNPKFRKMFSSLVQLIFSDIYTPTMGDTCATGTPILYATFDSMVRAFLKYHNPMFAQAAYLINGRTLEHAKLDIYGEDPKQIKAKIEKVIREKGELDLGGTNLTGYGFAAVREGKSGDFLASGKKSTKQRALWIYYGKTNLYASHGHNDALNMGLYAYGLDLMPDLGYPRYADITDRHRWSLVANTASHNTVTIDNQQHERHLVGQPLHFDNGGLVKLISIEDKAAYSAVARAYRRTSALIRIDEENSYVVDLFRVVGGSEHRYSFHAAETDGVQTSGLDLVKQADENGNYVGTYAGADLEYPFNADIDDPTGARYFFHVDKQAEKGGDFSVDYRILDTWNVLGNGAHAPTDIHVKLTMLGEFDQVALLDARPPENKVGNPETLRYVFAERRGQADLESCYTAVIEPYKGKSSIRSIQALPVTYCGEPVPDMRARALKVTLENGRVDYIVNAVDVTKEYTVTDGQTIIPFQGFFGVCSIQDGKVVHWYLNDAAKIADITNPKLSAATGTVKKFTKELSMENSIWIRSNETGIELEDLTGRYIYIENDGIHNAAYRIENAQMEDDGTIRLSTGIVSPVRSYQDAEKPELGYIYDVEAGKTFRIPLSCEG